MKLDVQHANENEEEDDELLLQHFDVKNVGGLND